MSKIEIGKKAPAFTLEGTGGDWSLKDAGGSVVLYFYPKDNTSGCTQEGQDFAALQAQFKKAKAAVLGISPDSVASHEKFKAKMEFPFDLLSDPAGAATRGRHPCARGAPAHRERHLSRGRAAEPRRLYGALQAAGLRPPEG